MTETQYIHTNTGDKVKITTDPKILQKYGLEVLLENPNELEKEYTIKYKSYGWFVLKEEPMWKYDFHPDMLIKL